MPTGSLQIPAGCGKDGVYTNRTPFTREAIMNRIPRRQFLRQTALAAAAVASNRIAAADALAGSRDEPETGRPLWCAMPVQDQRLA